MHYQEIIAAVPKVPYSVHYATGENLCKTRGVPQCHSFDTPRVTLGRIVKVFGLPDYHIDPDTADGKVWFSWVREIPVSPTETAVVKIYDYKVYWDEDNPPETREIYFSVSSNNPKAREIVGRMLAGMPGDS